MDIHSTVRVYNNILNLKGAKAELIAISDNGYYRLILEINGNRHEAFLPIDGTVLLSAEALEKTESIPIDRFY